MVVLKQAPTDRDFLDVIEEEEAYYSSVDPDGAYFFPTPQTVRRDITKWHRPDHWRLGWNRRQFAVLKFLGWRREGRFIPEAVTWEYRWRWTFWRS